MEIIEFCDICGGKQEFVVLSMNDCGNGYKEVVMQCIVCGKTIKKKMML